MEEVEEYKDRDRFRVVRATLESPNGGETSWTYVEGQDVVVIVAIDDEKKILIQREWRLGPADFVWQLPSGGMGKGIESTEENILAAADRELREEAGVTAAKLTHIQSARGTPHARHLFHFVIAEDLSESPLPADEHEFLQQDRLPIDEVLQRITREQIPTFSNITALLLARDHLEKI